MGSRASQRTSPNFRITPVAGSPLRLNALGLRESASARVTAVWRSGTHRFASGYAVVATW
ncbi:hypothetical protein V1289_006773 [Bradyrhizobium sp. AZCC 2289]